MESHCHVVIEDPPALTLLIVRGRFLRVDILSFLATITGQLQQRVEPPFIHIDTSLHGRLTRFLDGLVSERQERHHVCVAGGALNRRRHGRGRHPGRRRKRPHHRRRVVPLAFLSGVVDRDLSGHGADGLEKGFDPAIVIVAVGQVDPGPARGQLAHEQEDEWLGYAVMAWIVVHLANGGADGREGAFQQLGVQG